jgi:hypothetical protein
MKREIRNNRKSENQVHPRSCTPCVLPPSPSTPWTPLPDIGGHCTPLEDVDCRWVSPATAAGALATLLTQVTNPGDQVPTLSPTDIWPRGSRGSRDR